MVFDHDNRGSNHHRLCSLYNVSALNRTIQDFREPFKRFSLLTYLYSFNIKGRNFKKKKRGNSISGIIRESRFFEKRGILTFVQLPKTSFSHLDRLLASLVFVCECHRPDAVTYFAYRSDLNCKTETFYLPFPTRAKYPFSVYYLIIRISRV